MQNSINKISACAPATVANVSCGFDIFGFAVDQPSDEVEVTLVHEPGVRIKKISGDHGRLPIEAERNTCGVAVIKYLNAVDCKWGAEIILHKRLPLGSGMGSSAASAVAALVAINSLFDKPMTKRELLPFAMEAERVACGSAHADNVAPALLGGFTLIRSYEPLDVISIPVPGDIFCTLIHPHVELNTEDSRRVLRASIPLRDSITQSGNAAGLIAGLMKPDYGLIARSLRDVIAEPVRSLLIPGFEPARKIAMDVGALGCGISGSGPTIFSLTNDHEVASRVGAEVKKLFQEMSLKSDVFISKINLSGAHIISNTC